MSAISVCVTVDGSWLSLNTTFDGPAVRTESVFSLQYLLRTSVTCDPCVFDCTWYGPDDTGLRSYCPVFVPSPSGTGANAGIDAIHGQSP